MLLESIELLASSLNALNDNLTLHIYSNVADEIKEKIARKYRKTVFHDWVSHDEIPWILRNSRILYLPISIDKQTVKFTKYSMSTKMSEYLASGVPMLYHGPDGIAMTELLEKHQCAFVVKSNDERILLTLRGNLELPAQKPEMRDIDLILDPGFGFIGSTEADYQCMRKMDSLGQYHLPVLVGVSRKSMVWRPLGLTPETCLAATQALQMYALEHGATILRTHDVKETARTIKIFEDLKFEI